MRCRVPDIRIATVLIATALATACGPPVRVRPADPVDVHQTITGDILSTGRISGSSHVVLQRWGLLETWSDAPVTAITALQKTLVDGNGAGNEVFALAELCFAHAAEAGPRAQSYYLGSAVYAFAFLFPEGIDEAPSRYDPRLRQSADLYNRAVTLAFKRPDKEEVVLQPGIYEVPFGKLIVWLDPGELEWAGRDLTNLVPVANFEVTGLRARHRWPGLGAPLAATAVKTENSRDAELLAPRAKVPVTVVLRLDHARRDLVQGEVGGHLEVFPASQGRTFQMGDRHIPLESEPSAALAYQLARSDLWSLELKAFFLGDIIPQQTRLVSTEPHIPGRIPVVFVHGTASSPARWADMFNDLTNDPRIRERFEFWFFSYDTGNPILYSAWLLRKTLTDTVAMLDPEGTDPALRQMVVIGHSQGGLLTKMMGIDAGDRFWRNVTDKPFEQVKVSKETREILREAMFVKPLPFVTRVVFIATPHRGSYIAGNPIAQWISSFARFPQQVVGVVGDLASTESGVGAIVAQQGLRGSVYNMTPGHPFVKTISAVPIAPGIRVNSIVAVEGDGPVEDGSDGVVEYLSAHLADADSEVVVRSGHSCQADPEVIEEVRRILLEQAGLPTRNDGGAASVPPTPTREELRRQRDAAGASAGPGTVSQ